MSEGYTEDADTHDRTTKGTPAVTSRCVLFDMDGTLYESGIDFLGLRAELGLPRDGMPILAQLQCASAEVRERGIARLRAVEEEAAAATHPMPGASELMVWLRMCGVRCGLITNNSRHSVDVVLARHPLPFDVVLTRDDGHTKPHPQLVVEGMRRLRAQDTYTAMVGDTHLDALAAHAAGITRIHLVHLPTWMANQIPDDVGYSLANDLFEVKHQLGEWIVNGA